jgi:hypothetical protein
MSMHDNDTSIALRPLTFVPEDDGILVGCAGADSYAVFPPEGVAVLERLGEGMTSAEAARWHMDRYGEPLDIDDFLVTLHDLGFVRGAGDEDDAPAELRWRSLARALFSPLAWLCYAALAVACLWVLVRVPAVRPRPQQLFFSDSLLLVQVVLFAGQPLGMVWHEAFHVLAGRRLDLPCRLGVGRRLYFVVFESQLNGLLSLPRRKRYLPFLAGMLADVIQFSALIILAAACSTEGAGVLPTVGRVALALAFVTLLRFLWQFFLCLRTDLYYLGSTMLGCYDLHGATMARLRRGGRRYLRLPLRAADPEAAWTERDRQVARWYAPVAAVGFAFLIAVGALAMLPIAWEFAGRGASGLAQGALAPEFWDSVAAMLFTFGPLAVVLSLGLRERLRARPAPRTSHSVSQEGSS